MAVSQGTKRVICGWVGKSGTRYPYFVYSLPESFKEGGDGNYIYAKLVESKWRPIYIGQGDLGERVSPNHHKAKCIADKGATHVHAHLNSKESDRLAEEKDLLVNYSQAYEPTGCNEKG